MKFHIILASLVFTITASMAQAQEAQEATQTQQTEVSASEQNRCRPGDPETVQACCAELPEKERKKLKFGDGSCEQNMVCTTSFGAAGGFTCYLIEQREPNDRQDEQPSDQPRNYEGQLSIDTQPN